MTTLQEYCLHKMGITQWQLKRDNPTLKPYLLLLDETLDDAKKQLLQRLLQALKWEGKANIVTVFENGDIAPKIASAQKVVLFGQDLAQRNIVNQSHVVAVPSISQMLANVDAKKQAWAVLKKLINE
ncbi:MAG: DNA polymerase III subunit psi [Candidatus Berkiella sp.]